MRAETEKPCGGVRASDERLLDAFLRGRVDNRDFHHEDHVRVAFALLRRNEWPDAVLAFRNGLKAIAAKAGKPDAYNETISVAFLSLIAEQLSRAEYSSFPAFANANGALLDKSFLTRWYSKERLNSDTARRIFLLPRSGANDL
jgi:hypothetical protein